LFGANTVHAVSSRQLFIGTGDKYEILVYSLDGKLEHVWRRPTAPDTLTPAAITDTIRKLGELTRDAASRRLVLHWLSKAKRRTHYPFYFELRTDDRDRLWVRTTPPGVGRPQHWDVFRPDGLFLVTLELPANVRVLSLEDGIIIGLAVAPDGHTHALAFEPDVDLESPRSGG
jgi:hypothetical protein